VDSRKSNPQLSCLPARRLASAFSEKFHVLPLRCGWYVTLSRLLERCFSPKILVTRYWSGWLEATSLPSVESQNNYTSFSQIEIIRDLDNTVKFSMRFISAVIGLRVAIQIWGAELLCLGHETMTYVVIFVRACLLFLSRYINKMPRSSFLIYIHLYLWIMWSEDCDWSDLGGSSKQAESGSSGCNSHEKCKLGSRVFIVNASVSNYCVCWRRKSTPIMCIRLRWMYLENAVILPWEKWGDVNWTECIKYIVLPDWETSVVENTYVYCLGEERYVNWTERIKYIVLPD
jgi:hypothetical protein